MQEHQLADADDRILLAISGGKDSMAMLHLFANSGWNIEVAHCNFQLRDKESERDELLIRQVAKEYEVPVHVKRFATAEIARKNKQGIQITARELRYHWFNELLREHDLQAVAVAHHAEDQVETVLLNITRGAGLGGLRGMMPKRELIIRPLLWARKSEIEDYASLHNIQFREDCSNSDTTYRRNFLRHQVMPLLRELNPDFDKRMNENIELWQSAHFVLENHLQEKLLNRLSQDDQVAKLRFKEGDDIYLQRELLYYWLGDFGFHRKELSRILSALQANRTGTQFITNNYIVIVNRGELHLQENYTEDKAIEITREDGRIETVEGTLHISYSTDAITDLHLSSNQVAHLDTAGLEFPLLLRRWQEGDYFYPLGLGGKQKVSKYLKNAKLSRFEKKRVRVLEAEGEICWVVGMRLDERYKITDETKIVATFEWMKGNR